MADRFVHWHLRKTAKLNDRTRGEKRAAKTAGKRGDLDMSAKAGCIPDPGSTPRRCGS